MSKKSFMDSPASAFISPQQEIKTIPKGFKLDYRYIETKTKRVQVLMKPSTHQNLESKKRTGQSTNDFINEILEKYLG